MVYKEHYIEIYVNGNLLELESQNSLNLRFQNSIYDPEKISSTQAEYSFEFEIPSTPNNDKIFDYANNLSKLNKFRSRFDAEVYGDGTLIFQGTLTLNGFKDRKYQCNLVSVKVYSLEEIFGDAVLTDVPWSIPFEGAGTTDYTINYYNQAEEKVKFPLISYGAFQKSPLYSDEAGNDYSSKYDIDKYNKWYVESFAPSLNLLEYIKKAFNWKGYVVGGDAFTNPYLNNIYMSTNLADGQSPDYNIGNPKFGMVDLSATLTTRANDSGYQQELNFPYFRVGGKSESENVYNYNAVNIFNILSGNVTMNQSACYMYQPNENLIVVPADGFYKIELSASTTLNTTSAITAGQYTRGYLDDAPTEVDLELTPGLLEITPIEIALVKNYDDNYELPRHFMDNNLMNITKKILSLAISSIIVTILFSTPKYIGSVIKIVSVGSNLIYLSLPLIILSILAYGFSFPSLINTTTPLSFKLLRSPILVGLIFKYLLAKHMLTKSCRGFPIITILRCEFSAASNIS